MRTIFDIICDKMMLYFSITAIRSLLLLTEAALDTYWDHHDSRVIFLLKGQQVVNRKDASC